MQQASQLANLYLLVQIVDAGGLSAAARQQGITRSMISRRLMTLERELGVRLLHRDARHFSVTPIGEQVYRHAVMMCEAAHAAMAAARDARGLDGAQIRIGVDESLLPLASELLPAFAAQHPGIALSLEEKDLSLLARQRMDLALHAGELSADSTDLVARPLASLRWIVVASPSLLERLNHPRHPDQLSDGDCLSYGPDDWNLRGAQAQQRQPRLTSNHLPTVLAMAQAGLGFAQVPMHACQDDLLSGKLCPVFEAFETKPRPLHALTLPGQIVGQATLDFINFARQHLAGMGARGILSIS